MKKFTLILSVLLCLIAPLFAQGTIEYGDNDNFVRVISTEKTDDGYDILAADANGEEIIFHTFSETITNVNIESLKPGQLLDIRDNGMMTLSLPPQTAALQIRDLDLMADFGLVNIPSPVQNGVKEVKFESYESNNGLYRLFVTDKETGELFIYNCDHNTSFDVTPELLEEGDTLIIEDNGIMMMSIPAQLNAVSVTLPKVQGNTQTVTVEVADMVDGEFWILALDENGNYWQFLITEDTVIDGDKNGLVKGMDLIVTDNGMVTRSIPAKTSAVYIKVLSEELTSNVEDLVLKFGYTFGYYAMDSFMNQGLMVNGAYFARGVLDTLDLKEELLLPLDECYSLIENFPANYEEAGIKDPGFGEIVTTAAEVEALPAPTTLEDKFSYAWGFYATFNYMTQGIDLDRLAFPAGALTRLYGVPAELTMEEMDVVYNDYFTYKEMVYNQWIEEVTARNLEDANSFFKESEADETMTRINEYVVTQVMAENTDPGAMPTADDTVIVSYILQDLDGRLLDQGQNTHLALNAVIPGFRDALLSMHVGDHITAYVHPDAGYGEAGAAPYILPNSLLIFEIGLVGIEEPAEV